MLPDVTKITVEGYRSLEQTSIDLHRINILIGANGSGKSNFISLFDLLRAITQNNLQTHIAKCGARNPPNPNGIKTDYLWKDILNSIMVDHLELYRQFSDNPSFRKWLESMVFNTTYKPTTGET